MIVNIVGRKTFLMASKTKNTIPSYKEPPVNEVVCGMRILPSNKLLIPHIGLLWDKFRAEYPMLQHALPISSTKGELLVDRITNVPIPRVWFINTADDELIQFQNDRFYLNWRKKERDYPRYEYMISNFESLFSVIKDFFSDFNLGEVKPKEYELTYINHIPKGMGWETIDDLSEIFSDFLWKKPKTRFLPVPKEVNWVTVFPIQDQKGILNVSLKQGIRKEDELPIFVFELRALGFDSGDNLRNWFDIAHEWIVRGFTDLTTNKMHKIWGREDNV